MELVRYSGTEEWSALYVDGNLDTVGDHYLIDERISHLMGVKTIDSNAFMRGGNYREDVAPTLAELAKYENDREAKEAKQEALRAEAARLLAEADNL